MVSPIIAQSTLTHLEECREDLLESVPQLILALDCEQPLSPSVRLSLGEVDDVLIVRGPARRIERVIHEGRGRLVVRLTDRWMSSSHARLVRQDDTWTLQDLGSKNGTLVNGVACDKTVLRGGDVIEVGHTLLTFGEGSGARQPRQLSADELAPPLRDLGTFSAALAAQFNGLSQVARNPLVQVMVLGPTGTGKEVVARALHALSGRPGPFIAVNCGSISATLFEAELFGYRKGAFTGATEDRPGLIRAADGGTLFLDEIGDLSPVSQTSLLRVLQEREVLPLGGTRAVKVDLRVVTATHRDLGALTAAGRFREDLLARLAGYRVVLPALKDRREDLGILIAALLRRVTPRAEQVRFTGRAARALFRHAWPLNIRELEKCLATAAVLAGGRPIDLGHLPVDIREAPEELEEKDSRALSAEDLVRRDLMVELFRVHEGNVAAVARAMGKAAMQIHRWVKRYGLSLEDLRRRG